MSKDSCIANLQPFGKTNEGGLITSINPNDVLSGRGGASQNHPGNIQFRHLLQDRLKKNDIKYQRRREALDVVRSIRAMNPPGRFLIRDKVENGWREIGNAKALRKAQQRLRDLLKYEDSADEDHHSSSSSDEENTQISSLSYEEEKETRSFSTEKNKDLSIKKRKHFHALKSERSVLPPHGLWHKVKPIDSDEYYLSLMQEKVLSESDASERDVRLSPTLSEVSQEVIKNENNTKTQSPNTDE